MTENRGKGIRFTRDAHRDRPGQRRRRLQDGRLPQAVGHRRHARPGDPGEDRRAERAAGADPRHVRSAARRRSIPRADQCGDGPTGGTCESLVGNVVTDAMRTTYSAIGVQFAITNSGGLRADLTCPTADHRGRLLPGLLAAAVPDHARPVAGRAAVREHRGHARRQRRRAEDDARERRLAHAGACDGRFPQVSGLCFTYDIAAPPAAG